MAGLLSIFEDSHLSGEEGKEQAQHGHKAEATTSAADCETPCLPTMPDVLPPEVEIGNVEYKLKLIDPSSFRLEHLISQMKWRLQEGHGEAFYEIGVEDNGILHGLTDEEMNHSLETLRKMANRLGADLNIVREKEVETGESGKRKRVAEVMVCSVPEDRQFIDLRLAVLGNVDAGKSTLISVLTHGELDNGRGQARLNLFRHLHEIQTGRTSSISHEILGFDRSGQVLNYSNCSKMEEICERSSKLITLMDLCGHQKYLKTTMFGLTGYAPDFAMLAVSCLKGFIGTSREHLGYAFALNVPIFIVITKVDMCSDQQTEKCIRQLEAILKSPGCKRVPYRISSEDDAITAASSFRDQKVCPIFSVSAVTGTNLELIFQFLNLLPPVKSQAECESLSQQDTDFHIDAVYTLPDVGKVVCGMLLEGSIKAGDRLLLGPRDDGTFCNVYIDNMHRNRQPCRLVTAGQAASLSLGHFTGCKIRKGMVLMSEQLNPKSCVSFEANVYVFYHIGYICKNFQTVVHVGNVCQTAKITKISRPRNCLRTNEKALVEMSFINRPEYVRPGTRILFREGKTKGMGEVTKVFYLDSPLAH